MKQLTIYHQDIPITQYPLDKQELSIGSNPACDITLAADTIADRQLVIIKDKRGRWRARSTDGSQVDIDLSAKERFPIGPYALSVEPRDAGTSSIGDTRRCPPQDCFGLVGVSIHLCLLKREITRLGPLGAPLSITGATGTGKELIARGLHQMSRRPDGPLVAVNCGALTQTLLEDTLFGHEKGAFTGAQSTHRGIFEQAKGGTLFLDEVGELPLAYQAALLRVLDDRKVCRIGGEKTEQTDFRLITATNRDLAEMVDNGEFRRDLYHRITTLTINTLPLKERPEDIAPLARHFLGQFTADVGQRELSPASLEKLRAYDWPGNARELHNVLYRAAALEPDPILAPEALDIPLNRRAVRRRNRRLVDIPSSLLNELLDRHAGNVAAVARELGLPRTSLRDHLRQSTKRAAPHPPLTSLPVELAS